MPTPLENLSGPGKPLKAEAPDAQELAGLLRSGLIAATQVVADALQARLP